MNRLVHAGFCLFTLLLVSSACRDIFSGGGERPSVPPHSDRATQVYRLTQTPEASTIPPHTVSASPTGVPLDTDKEVVILQQATDELNCSPYPESFGRPSASVNGAVRVYYVGCTAATGHSATIQIKRYPSPPDARSAFEPKWEGCPNQLFHGYPACEWQFDENADNPQFPMRHRFHAWLADRWLVLVESFDDTHYAIAPEPIQASEVVYAAAQAHDLIPVE